MNYIKLHYKCYLIFLSLLLSQRAFAITADFSGTNTTGCSPLSVNFTDKSTGASGTVKYLWRLGNGNISSLQNPSAIYITPGTYNITLIVKDASGSIDSITKTKFISVFANPTANYKSSNSGGCPPVTVGFTDLSTKGSAAITGYTWDFGDGVTSNSQNPSHTYKTQGKYDVKLNVTDANGCSNTITKAGSIVVFNAPVISFTSNDSMSCSSNFTVNFTSKASSALGGKLSYKWNFGDSGSATTDNPSYTFTKNGIFSVSLTVTDSVNCSTTITKKDYIWVGRQKPDFSFNPSSGCPPLFVSFTNNTTPGWKGNKYYWDFGDSSSATFTNPGHLFSKSGTYSVKLKVVSLAGCADSITKSNIIKVLTVAPIDYTSSDSLGCHKDFDVSFATTASGKAYFWDFGDHLGVSSSQNPSYKYRDTGAYAVSLTFTDNNGCKVIKKKNNIIVRPPSITIKKSAYKGCIPLVVNFSATVKTILPIVKYEWHWGDGSPPDIGLAATHIFFKEGYFDVYLVFMTQNGCMDSILTQVKAGCKPDPDFSADKLVGCRRSMKVTFTNLTTKGSGCTTKPDSFIWDTGTDKIILHNDTPLVYQYPPTIKPKKYTVKLYVYNKGCGDSIVKKDYIEILAPSTGFNFSQNPCKIDTVHFISNTLGATSLKWDFGDGGTSTDSIVNHYYNTIGTYPVDLIAINDTTHCVDTFKNIIHIDPPLTVAFTSKDTGGCAPYKVQFRSTTNELVTYYWDFGDGVQDHTDAPLHTYADAGTYKVSLKVLDSKGCSATVVHDSMIKVSGPHIKFSASPLSGCMPITVKIVDSSSKKGILSKTIDFGDGTPKQIVKSDSFYHTYNTPIPLSDSFYTITMSANDKKCGASYSIKVFANKPSAKFDVFTQGGCNSIRYSFVPSQDAGSTIRNFDWDFGDGTKSKDKIVNKQYTSDVNTTVTLITTDNNGCRDTSIKKLNFKVKKLKAGFKASPLKTSCPPTLVTFTDTSQSSYGKIVKYLWDFGDGTSSTLPVPQKLYVSPGHFNIKLRVIDENNCVDSITKPSYINIAGARGSFTFDKKHGCENLTVTFTAKTGKDIKFIWDMGDGSRDSGQVVTYAYKSTGRYIPALILSDSLGCTYAIPANDTIVVEPNPKPNFSNTWACNGQPTNFTDLSNPVKGTLFQWHWDLGDGESADIQNPSHIYSKPGKYLVGLTAYSTSGCFATIKRRTKIGGIIADIRSSKPAACVGYPFTFSDSSYSDTIKTSWHWTFGDGGSSTVQHPQHTFYKKGFYPVKLVVKDTTGCVDSMIISKFLVGDTTPPPPATIYHVSVVDDNTVLLDFKKYKDIDFFRYYIYRKDPGASFNLIDTIKNINDTIYTDRGLKTLPNVYCYKVIAQNICGYIGFLDSAKEHCTINISGTAGINKSLLTWTPYQGWPVSKYIVYREDIYNKGVFQVLDSVPGSNLSYIDTSIICYRTHHYKVLAIEKGGYKQNSWSDTTAVTPIYIPHVPPTALVRATVENNTSILIEWKDLAQRVRIKHFLLERSDDNGKNYKLIDTPYPRQVIMVKDFKVKVSTRSYTYRLRIMDSCGDLGPYSNIGKTILLKVDTTPDLKPLLHWSKYTYWNDGVKYYDIELKKPDGSFSVIDKTAGPNDTVYVDNKTDFNSLPRYCYRVTAHQNGPADSPDRYINITSSSNEACAPIHPVLYVPNVFTPNGDSLNDQFLVSGLYIRDINIAIYDRWGTKVFETNNIHKGWDGYFKGGLPLMDAYRVVIRVTGANDEKKYYFGWVTVLP